MFKEVHGSTTFMVYIAEEFDNYCLIWAEAKFTMELINMNKETTNLTVGINWQD